MVNLISDRAMNRVISHMPEVRQAVRDWAEEAKGRAEERLAPHHKSGEVEVTLSHGETDSFVNLEGASQEALLSIEFGHWVRGRYESKDHPRKVVGLHILTSELMGV